MGGPFGWFGGWRLGRGWGCWCWWCWCWWFLVLVVPVVVGDGWVEAQKVVPTDTTLATGNTSRGEGSEGVSTRSHCSYGHRRDGSCRACQRRTYRSSGGMCVPVERTPGCPTGHARVATWPDDCVRIACPLNPNSDILEWRSLTTGRCLDPPTTAATTTGTPSVIPDIPDQVKANGDSRGVSDGGGQSVVTWNRVSNATSYKVRHSPPASCDRRPCPVWTDYTFTDSDDEDTNADTITITLPRPDPGSRLSLNTFYTIEVVAVNSSGESQAAVGYTYTTRDPLPGHTVPVNVADFAKVGIVAVAGYRASVAGVRLVIILTQSVKTHFLLTPIHQWIKSNRLSMRFLLGRMQLIS